MTKTLTRHGHSLALLIDRGVLDILKIDEKTPLDISTDGRVLIIMPARAKARQKAFQSALASDNKQYGRMYRRLAKEEQKNAA